MKPPMIYHFKNRYPLRNYTTEELAELIVDTVLHENMLNKKELLPKVHALVKTMVDLKNVPRNYNAYVSPNKNAARLRTIEQKTLEIKFWRDLVKQLDPDRIQEYYKQHYELMVKYGFKSYDND